MSADGTEQPHAAEKKEHGMHATRIDDRGLVIDEVTGEEIEPVVTLKTWIVVLVCRDVSLKKLFLTMK
jgi:hypothetical protein